MLTSPGDLVAPMALGMDSGAWIYRDCLSERHLANAGLANPSAWIGRRETMLVLAVIETRIGSRSQRGHAGLVVCSNGEPGWINLARTIPLVPGMLREG